MGGKQRIYKQRIASTQTLAKVFRAMEMIAASRIGGARRAATALGPYEKDAGGCGSRGPHGSRSSPHARAFRHSTCGGSRHRFGSWHGGRLLGDHFA